MKTKIKKFNCFKDACKIFENDPGLVWDSCVSKAIVNKINSIISYLNKK
jgi:hypothetical protein